MKALFLSDNHYGSYGGRLLLPVAQQHMETTYLEDDYGRFLETEDLSHFDALITCAIGDTPGAPHAPDAAEARVRDWMALGRPIILIHGGSATFWKWDWWRESVGLRWVRGNDPDGVAPSCHPIVSYQLTRAKSRHPLANALVPWTVPEDELYIELEETRPVQRLLEASWEGKSYPMAYACRNRWGGMVLGYLPGHKPEVVANVHLKCNVSALVQHLPRCRAAGIAARS